MIVEIETLTKKEVSKYGKSIVAECHPIIDSPFFEFGGCVDLTRVVRLVYPDNKRNMIYLNKAKKNQREYFEFFESAFIKDTISIGICYVHKSFFEKNSSSNKAGNAIDLGLSVLWADMNVGASVPSDYGNLYGYGDITGEKTSENEKDYPHKDIVNTENDIAKAIWGDEWRMPTVEELKELCAKCQWKQAYYNGVIGSEVTGPNGNSIFLPFAGCRIGIDSFRQEQLGMIWAGNLGNFGNPVEMMYYNSAKGSLNYGANAANGHSVRPVKDNIQK